MQDRILDYDGNFSRGMKSDSAPGALALGYYWTGMNVLNIGGQLSCRPGYHCLVKFPRGRLQGATIFRPRVGLEQFIAAIDGVIYAAPWPFNDFRALPNIQFSSAAKQIFWKLTTQSARRINNDFSSPIEVITPRNVLFMQDGGFSAAGWYDGSQSGHLRDNAFATPVGSSMEWVGDRLWVAKGNEVLASDIANPFSFREQNYLGGVSAFVFDREVTALAKTSSIQDFGQLIVWTDSTTSIIQSNIRNRSNWINTDNMQREIFPIGNPSQRSVVSHFGRISWFSPAGVVFLDSAVAGNVTARIPIRDNEMAISKRDLQEDLSLVAGAAFGQFILMSVPFADLYNKHTWVLNHASQETLSDDSGPSWASFWTGTRPVEWVYGTISGAERIYHVSTDEDGENRLWECFRPDRLDNGCPITWAIETRGYFGPTSPTKKTPGSDCRFLWAEVSLSGIAEDLDLGIFYAGHTRGAYKQIADKKFSVERGSLISGQELTATTPIFAFKPQMRHVRTEDAKEQTNELDSGTCPVESSKIEELDDAFQLLIVGHGPATVNWIRAIAFTSPEDLSGDPRACEDETGHKAIRFDGAGAQAEELPGLVDTLAAQTVSHYTSVQTASVTQGDLTAVGIGVAESVVSQRAADRVAVRIAEKLAEADLAPQVPPVLSVGEGFDE